MYDKFLPDSAHLFAEFHISKGIFPEYVTTSMEIFP
jgi:hypothetical protein